MSEKSMSKDTRKNVILLHIAVMCFSCSGVIGQYVQVPAVQVAMGRVICSSLLLLAISLVCKDKLTLDSKKDYGADRQSESAFTQIPRMERWRNGEKERSGSDREWRSGTG